jgi:hypothetical protein
LNRELLKQEPAELGVAAEATCWESEGVIRRHWPEDRSSYTCSAETTMTRVEQLEQQIVQLNPDEFAQLRECLMEEDWAEWDLQIERDAASRKLDRLSRHSSS